MPDEKGILNKFSPKANFFAGVGLTVAVFFIIGFFVLLALFLRADKEELAGNNNAANNQVAGDAAAEPAEVIIEPVNDADWVRGERGAKISLIEFSDLECPFCKQFHATMQDLLAQYPGDVNWVYRHFPLTSLHTKAPKEAEAAECAGELGGNDGFWKYIDEVFAVTPSNDNLDLAQLPEIADQIGLDKDEFNSCLTAGKYANKVGDQYEQAVSAGGQGTPYTVILSGDQKIPVSGAVPLSQLKSIIDSLLAP